MNGFSKLTWLKLLNDEHGLTLAELTALLVIFNHSNEHGKGSYPGLKRIQGALGSKRPATASEAISGLKRKGWIREVSKGSGHARKNSEFELIQERLIVTPERKQEEPSLTPQRKQVVTPERKPTDPISDPSLTSDPREGTPERTQSIESNKPDGLNTERETWTVDDWVDAVRSVARKKGKSGVDVQGIWRETLGFHGGWQGQVRVEEIQALYDQLNA